MLFPEGDLCFQSHSTPGNCSTTSFLPGHLVQCAVWSQERQLPLRREAQVSISSKGTEQLLLSRQGWRFRVGLSRWHSYFWSQHRALGQQLGLAVGLGLNKLRSLKSCSWEATGWELSSTAGDNLWALAMPGQCIVICASL